MAILSNHWDIVHAICRSDNHNHSWYVSAILPRNDYLTAIMLLSQVYAIYGRNNYLLVALLVIFMTYSIGHIPPFLHSIKAPGATVDSNCDPHNLTIIPLLIRFDTSFA